MFLFELFLYQKKNITKLSNQLCNKASELLLISITTTKFCYLKYLEVKVLCFLVVLEFCNK